VIAAHRFEIAPPPLAIDVGGQDLTSGSTTWTALPDVGETTFSAADSRRELDYMHARFNSPITGRMLSVDPEIGTFNIPQSWNRYAYVTGNPLRYTDPTGQLPAYALAEIAQRYFGELREEAMSALSTGSLAGVIAATLAGSTLDAASALAEPLRAGEAIGTAVGSGAGAGEMALAVGQDSLRAAGLVAPLAGAGRSAVARTGAGFIDDAARLPVGSLRHPMSVVGRPNIPGTIGGRKYTGHALDQMQGRGIPPSVVEDTLARGTRTPGRGGAMVFTTNQARVVVNPNGSIKTVMGQ
jgi:RHS repeat-associated protein